MVTGLVMKKNARVMWRREREDMIVAPEMIPMLKICCCVVEMDGKGEWCGKSDFG